MSMIRPAVLAVLLLSPAIALAQQNGNERNGLDYQPTQGGVNAKERAAGVAPPPAEQRARTGAVDDIYKQLMSKENTSASGPGQPAVVPLQPGPAAPR